MDNLTPTDTINPSDPIIMVGKTASKLSFRVHDTDPAPGPGFVTAPEDAAFACIVAVPGGPMKGFGGGSVCAAAFTAKNSKQAPSRSVGFRCIFPVLCLLDRRRKGKWPSWRKIGRISDSCKKSVSDHFKMHHLWSLQSAPPLTGVFLGFLGSFWQGVFLVP